MHFNALICGKIMIFTPIRFNSFTKNFTMLKRKDYSTTFCIKVNFHIFHPCSYFWPYLKNLFSEFRLILLDHITNVNNITISTIILTATYLVLERFALYLVHLCHRTVALLFQVVSLPNSTALHTVYCIGIGEAV